MWTDRRTDGEETSISHLNKSRCYKNGLVILMLTIKGKDVAAMGRCPDIGYYFLVFLNSKPY